MPPKAYKVGEKSSTGQVIAEILGQSPFACVFTTTDNQLRWVYYRNKGVLPDELGPVISKFDALMADITGLKGAAESKRRLYILLGKCLFLALNTKNVQPKVDVFTPVEAQISALENPTLNSPGPLGKTKRFSGNVDLAIVCALHQPELSAILSLGRWTKGPLLAGDPQTYYSARWRTNTDKKLQVVVAAPNNMGLTASGVLAAKMIMQFRPKLFAMAGVAAGSRSDKQGFGDILFPDQTFDYGEGKTISVKGKSQILPGPNPIQVNPRLLGRLKEWQRERTGLDEISKKWPAARPPTQLAVHIGPLFSSPTVIDDPQPVKDLTSHWRKLVGIEMEAHAVHRACNDTIEPAPLFCCAKSVCDFAKGKNDDWQHYAAFTSALFLHKFIKAEWSTLLE